MYKWRKLIYFKVMLGTTTGNPAVFGYRWEFLCHFVDHKNQSNKLHAVPNLVIGQRVGVLILFTTKECSYVWKNLTSASLFGIVWRNLQVSQYPHNSVRTNFQLHHFMRSSFMHTYWSQAQSSLYVSYLQGPLSSAVCTQKPFGVA